VSIRREQLVARIEKKACQDAAFSRLVRGYTESQVRLMINIILKARRDVAEEVRAEETPPTGPDVQHRTLQQGESYSSLRKEES